MILGSSPGKKGKPRAGEGLLATQPCRVLRARLLPGFNPPRDGLVFFHGPLPIPTSGFALCRRAVRDGLHRVLQLSDPALWPVARHERRPDWDACRRAFVAGRLPVDPCRRAYGPIGHSPGCLVLCLDGDGLGAGLPAAAVVLALTAAAGRQWRRSAVCLVGFADLDRAIGRRRGPSISVASASSRVSAQPWRR